MFRPSPLQKERRDRAIMARVSRLPFSKHPAFNIACEQEAYKNYVFGGRAGPSIDLENIFHELAHAAQFGPAEFERRCTRSGSFRFLVHKVVIGGEEYEEPTTAECTLRELETFAIQYHLLAYVGRKIDFDAYATQVVSICSFLPDWSTLGGIEGRKSSLPRILAEFTQHWDADRAIRRIFGWLDQTSQRLSVHSCEA